MKNVTRSLFLFLGSILLIGIFFNLYSQFAVDYSLEILETTLSAADARHDTQSPLQRQALGSMLQDMVVEEAGKNSDLHNLTLLEMASKSLDQPATLENTKVYLNRVRQAKLAKRQPLLRTFDIFYRNINHFLKTLNAMAIYLKNKISPRAIRNPKNFEYRAYMILSEAAEYSKEGQPERAIEIYQSYLEHYPDSQDSGLAKIAIAKNLKQLKKFREAKHLLQNVKADYLGRLEEQVAEQLLRQIADHERREQVLADLKSSITSTDSNEFQRFKLGMAYLSAYDMDNAKNILESLKHSKNPEIRQRAGFYLAWVLKKNLKYGESASVFLSLLEDEKLEKEFNRAIRAQLADVYRQSNQIENSISQYDRLLSSSEISSADPVEKAWISLAEIEKSGLYHFRGSAEDSVTPLPGRGEMRGSAVDLRDQAIQALGAQKVNIAYDLLKSCVKTRPDDPWINSTLAIVYILFKDLNRAMESALKGYNARKDEYTTSVLAYVYDVFGRYDEAIDKYREAESISGDYFPAVFNRATIELHLKRYQLSLKIYTDLYKKLQNRNSFVKAKILNNMGVALSRMGYQDQALERFEQSLKALPGYSLASYNKNQLRSILHEG